MRVAIAAILTVFLCGLPAHADVALSDINTKWLEESVEKIDQFSASCQEGMDCATQIEKRYTDLCDLLTKKISALCRKQGGGNAAQCQEELGKFLEANTNARMEAGKLQRHLNAGQAETKILEKIFASDMILLNAYIDALGTMLEK